jgi:hypothetical protein
LKQCGLILQVLVIILVSMSLAYGWHDETHLAVAKAAGYWKWYNAAGPDLAKEKAGPRERLNHYFDNTANVPVTPEMVLAQVHRYNTQKDAEGHLYGAILGSLRAYARSTKDNKYAEYHLAYCAHYVADLSQPLHNTAYDDFNKAHHQVNDGILEREALNSLPLIQGRTRRIILRQDHFEDDVAREIAIIAEKSRKLGMKLRAEQRDMTRDEALVQLAESASLLQAILDYVKGLESTQN